ncbi:unnamed protein product, partial [Mycena citricolor]
RYFLLKPPIALNLIQNALSAFSPALSLLLRVFTASSSCLALSELGYWVEDFKKHNTFAVVFSLVVLNVTLFIMSNFLRLRSKRYKFR